VNAVAPDGGLAARDVDGHCDVGACVDRVVPYCQPFSMTSKSFQVIWPFRASVVRFVPT
jgi:hypothetical protein